MASQEEIERLVGKALVDPKFREEFTADCSAAAGKLGIKLTDEQKKTFSSAQFARLSGELEKIQSKGGVVPIKSNLF